MKNFLFRLSRLIFISSIIIHLSMNVIMFLDGVNIKEFTMFFLLFTTIFSIPTLIFNWLCFGKFTFWIKNPNKENE